MNIINSCICYIEKDGKYLMLHRTKKEKDINKEKWIGVGGKVEDKESPEDCVVREVKEETGLDLISYKLRGLITYVSTEWETEYMYLFTSNEFVGDLIECNEGDLEWVDKKELFNLNLWEGDRLFLKELENNNSFFTMKFNYDGDNLISHEFYQY